MEEFSRPSTERKTTLLGGLGIGVALAVGIAGLQFVADFVDARTQTHSGQFILCGLIVTALVTYWRSFRRKLDEIGQRLETESGAFAMKGILAAGVGLVFLWPIAEVRDVFMHYGFPMFFGLAGILHALGFQVAKRRLA